MIDKAWGGFYRAATYLMIGQRKSGRTSLALQFAKECVKQKEVCLYITNIRPKELLIHASSIDFDLQEAMNKNEVIVVKVVPPTGTEISTNPDQFLAEYLKDIITVVDEYQPTKIVFDELTPFIEFENPDYLHDVFAQTIEEIEDMGITNFFVLSDPATEPAVELIESLVSASTGVIYLKKDDEGTSGEITITPNVGHPEGKFKAKYKIEPYIGMTFDENKVPESPSKNTSIKEL